MTKEATRSTVREAVGVFATEHKLQKAIDDLLLAGFSRADLSLLASETALKEKLGHADHRPAQLEDDPSVPRTSYVAPESIGDAKGGLIAGLIYLGAGVLMVPVAMSGAGLVAITTAAVVGGSVGGGVGAVLASFIGAQNADRIAAQLTSGGLILWVRTWNREQEQSAVEILSRNSGQDVHIHEFPYPEKPAVRRTSKATGEAET